MSKQPPTRTYCKCSRPLPYCNPNCRTPRHWKFTQHHRTTRPPPTELLICSSIPFERYAYPFKLQTARPVTALQEKHLHPLKPGNLSMGHRQTVQTKIRRHIMWRLIRVYIACYQDFPSKIKEKQQNGSNIDKMTNELFQHITVEESTSI